MDKHLFYQPTSFPIGQRLAIRHLQIVFSDRAIAARQPIRQSPQPFTYPVQHGERRSLRHTVQPQQSHPPGEATHAFEYARWPLRRLHRPCRIRALPVSSVHSGYYDTSEGAKQQG